MKKLIISLLLFTTAYYSWADSSGFMFELSPYYSNRSNNLQGYDLIDFYRYEKIPSLFEISYNLSIENFYLEGKLPLKRSFDDSEINTCNIPCNLNEIDTTFPFRGKIGYDNNIFSIEIARDVPEIGPGRLSSTEFNKQIPYTDYASASLRYKNFSLTEYYFTLDPILLSEEERIRQESISALNITELESYDNRIKSAVYHQFRWELDTIDIAFGGFLVVGGNPVTPANLNPLLIYHNFYEEDSSNCFAFFNISKNFGKTDIYFDITADDLKAVTESSSDSGNVIASLVGLDYKNKLLRTTFEIAYVSTMFGLRTKPLQSPYSRILYLDNSNGGKRVYADYPLFYYLGNDLIDTHFFLDFYFNRFDINIFIQNYLKGSSSVTDNPSEVNNDSFFYPSGKVDLLTNMDISLLCRLNRNTDFKGGVNMEMDNFKDIENSLFFSLACRF